FELGGAQMRLLAGEAWGHSSPVRFAHPIWYLAGDAPDGARFDIPGEAAQERAVYVADGIVKVGSETLTAGSMGILAEGCSTSLAAEADAKFMLAGGAPYPEKRLIEWNLVATDRDLIEQAKADWQASIDADWWGERFTLPDGEEEWIPLPS
ncbi:MAG: pirin-like C-terminal cupin domain-containing protein, partial [Pseudomonadota bacterium]